METKPKSNLFNMKQEEFSKLRNDETILIKPADEREALVILSAALSKAC